MREPKDAGRRAGLDSGQAAPSAGNEEIRVALSTSAVYPSRAPHAFQAAAELGYDGVEVMVWSDRSSQNARALQDLSAQYGVPVTSIHAPSLVLSQNVWGRLPGPKLERSVDLALEVGASTVVVHPPFRWQRRYAHGFAEHVHELTTATGLRVAVENMFPWQVRGRKVNAYLPGWDPTDRDYENITLDLSHAAVARQDGLELLRRIGDRVSHLHLADGVPSIMDQHLVPGRGTQPCAQVLRELAGTGWSGDVVVEVQTRKAPSAEHVRADLAAALDFARAHLRAGANERRRARDLTTATPTV
ncbi:sugar phosphate isomerase/epimerase family protein [Pseudactinotalea sp. Z1748]|uniref:sugar phosphate isomerase/epimerase family protein n=1 Tax=Pseudactinotalea sp. Z1748 TaxID=3413027 RepID=UPI003C7CFE22